MRYGSLGAAALATSLPLSAREDLIGIAPSWKISLKADAIGLAGPVVNLLSKAAEIGFQAIAMPSEELVAMGARERAAIKQKAADLGLAWGSAGLPVQFRNSQEEFDKDLARLPAHARAMFDLGIRRVGTWIMPGTDSHDYTQNMELHANRLRLAAQIMADHGVQLGLEYVGPRTLRDRFKFAFIQNGKQLKELIAAIDLANVGVILDSFHWYCAEESLDDLRIWTNEDIVAVDLNDADRNLMPRTQIDGNRELPGATGTIDLAGFVGFLNEVQYNGPIRAEPFNATLNAMDDELAMRATLMAMEKSLSI